MGRRMFAAVVPPEDVREDLAAFLDHEAGLHVEYFGSQAMEGAPLFTGRDSVLDANWHDRSPREDIDDDDFGVRWTGVSVAHRRLLRVRSLPLARVPQRMSMNQ